MDASIFAYDQALLLVEKHCTGGRVTGNLRKESKNAPTRTKKVSRD